MEGRNETGGDMTPKSSGGAYFGGTPSSTPGTGTIIPGTPMDDADEQYQYTTNRPFLQSQSQSQTQSQTLGSTPTTPRSNVGPTNAALRGNNFITGTPTSAATTPIIPRGDLGGNRPISHKRVHLTSEHIPGTPFTPTSPSGAVARNVGERGFNGNMGMDLRDAYGNGGGFDNIELHGGYEPATTAAAVGATIWGTDIRAETICEVFRDFLNNFTTGGRHGGKSTYMVLLEELYNTQRAVLNLDCSHLKDYIGSRRLYSQLISFPQEVIPLLDQVTNEEYERAFGPESSMRLQVRCYNLSGSSRPMRDLNPENIDQLVSLKGLVIRCSPVIPDIKQAFFRCCSCANTQDVLIQRGRIDEPTRCETCRMQGSMELIHNRCLFSDKQLVRLQENISEIPEGETPQTISLFVFDELVDTVKPGDRMEVVGIYRAIPRRVNPKTRTVRSLYKTYIDVVHFRPADQSSDGESTVVDDSNILYPATPHKQKQNITGTPHTGGSYYGDNSNTGYLDDSGGIAAIPPELLETSKPPNESSDIPHFSADRIKEFKRFVADGNVYSRLVTAFAPSIWEMDDVKRGILCQLFGGSSQATQKRRKQQISRANKRKKLLEGEILEEEDEDASHQDRKGDEPMHERRDINILLCGDPGTSKSQLLSYVHKITPRGIYTSGKGSSAVGLTASVIRDPETKDMVLESGALVLSDNGICCIDEFDKMSESTRAILHEAMEQQTVSITKAGIIATLNARTSILASANPVESRYNPKLSVVSNLKLPPTLLSRFDLIYLILDKPSADSDRRLARHLVSLYYPSVVNGTQDDVQDGDNQRVIDQEFLKDFIQYARYTCAPEITAESAEVLVQGYLLMRGMGGSSTQSGSGTGYSGAGSKTISATPRQLESLIRLSQALAKMRLSDVVLKSDVEEAIRLMRVATQAAATDPRTGTIDMDMISTGRSSLDRDAIARLSEELLKLFEARKGETLSLHAIRQAIERVSGDNSLTVEDIEEALRDVPDNVAVFIERTKNVSIRA